MNIDLDTRYQFDNETGRFVPVKPMETDDPVILNLRQPRGPSGGCLGMIIAYVLAILILLAYLFAGAWLLYL